MTKFQVVFVPDASVRDSMSSYLTPGFVCLHADAMVLQEVDTSEAAAQILKRWIDLAPTFGVMGSMDDGFAEALVCRIIATLGENPQKPLREILFYLPWSSNSDKEKEFFKTGKTAISKFRGPALELPGSFQIRQVESEAVILEDSDIVQESDLDKLVEVAGVNPNVIFFNPDRPVEVGAIRTTDGKLWNMDQSDEAFSHQRTINARAAFKDILEPEWFRDIPIDTVLDLLSKNVDQFLNKLK